MRDPDWFVPCSEQNITHQDSNQIGLESDVRFEVEVLVHVEIIQQRSKIQKSEIH